jgi:hypothetical protein
VKRTNFAAATVAAVAAVAVVVLACSSVARADSSWVREPGPRYIVHKSPRYATKLSIAGTLTGVVMLFAGAKMGNSEGDVMKGLAATTIVVAPSWGEWWVQDRVVVTPGMAARAVGVLASGAAIGIDHKCNALARMTDGSTGCASTERNDTALGIGIGLVVAGAVYDIVDAGRQAEKRRFIVVPAVSPTSAGIGLTAAF